MPAWLVASLIIPVCSATFPDVSGSSDSRLEPCFDQLGIGKQLHRTELERLVQAASREKGVRERWVTTCLVLVGMASDPSDSERYRSTVGGVP